MIWTEINFGKHKGKTLPQILFKDPDWFFWSKDDNIWKDKDSSLQEQFHFIYERAKKIAIPDNENGDLIVEYNLFNGSIYGFDIVKKDAPRHSGSTRTFREPLLNLKIPKNQKRYDKQGYKHFMSDFKSKILKNSKIRFTKKICESFFENESNFKV